MDAVAASGNWTFTEVDAAIADRVQPLLPEAVFDVHAHLYRVADLGEPCPDLARQGPEVISVGVWRSALASLVGASRVAGGLFIPYPTKAGDVDAGNAFVVSQIDQAEGCRGLVVVTPGSLPEAMEDCLRHPRIVGFKPYHLYAPVSQTFDAAIEDYLPAWAWELADARHAVIMLHLVRAGALSDPDNQRTIISMCGKYPGARLILAHAGRGFHAPNTIAALPALRGLGNVWFDASAICEPDALMAIIKTLGAGRLLWGSDFPVSQQRGKCVTVGDAFSWICPRRIDVDPGAPECRPTLVGLESLRALLLAADLLDLTRPELENIFMRNAGALVGL